MRFCNVLTADLFGVSIASISGHFILQLSMLQRQAWLLAHVATFAPTRVGTQYVSSKQPQKIHPKVCIVCTPSAIKVCCMLQGRRTAYKAMQETVSSRYPSMRVQ